MAGTLQVETFHPVTTPAPDWSEAANWSGSAVPGAGIIADIIGTKAAIDPGITIEADVSLTSSDLIGNGGAIVLGAEASVSIAGTASFYAYDSVVNQGALALGAGSALDVVVDLGAISGLTGAPPPSFANTGTIGVASGGMLDIGGTEFENQAVVALAGGTLDVSGGAIGGSGTISLANNALAAFGDEVAAQSFIFGAEGGTVSLADPLLGIGVTVSGFGGGDVLLLLDLADARIVQNAGRVTILNRFGTAEGSFADPSGTRLTVIADGPGSAIVAASTSAVATTPDPPCFVRGTAILTPTGYRAVESLRPGDTVITAAGSVQPIVWVGSRTLDLATHPKPDSVQPVEIAPGAFGPGVPRRALRVSPDHALSFDGVLIPAKLLVNGATIRRERDCMAVTYHHIELTRHDIVLAEGAACESYLDTGNRAGFEPAVSWPVRRKRWDCDACAPLCTTGPILRTVRTRLHARATELGFSLRHDYAVTLWIDDAPIQRRAGPAGEARFVVPARHGGHATIRSARFIPAEFDPTSEDRRHLGIAITRLHIGLRQFAPEAMADSGFLPRASGDSALWTDGAGVIRLPPEARHLAIGLAALPLMWTRPGAERSAVP